MQASDWPSATVAQRHAAMTDRSGGPDACWPWIGYLTPAGYGRMTTGTSLQVQVRLAHRVAFVLANGQTDDTLTIDHMCHTHACQNPRHLREVTRTVNCSTPGRGQPQARLTDADVLAIRAEYRPGVITQRSLARKYGVSQVTIQHILARRDWRHV